ncbi:MAG: hypothetical protein KDA53_10250 [Hyphomonas sp.]|nr:hypothetical protein [Hyphomonas sp.]
MADDKDQFPAPQPLSEEARAAQKRRNLWLGLALLGFVVLVAITTFVRLSTGTGIAGRM